MWLSAEEERSWRWVRFGKKHNVPALILLLLLFPSSLGSSAAASNYNFYDEIFLALLSVMREARHRRIAHCQLILSGSLAYLTLRSALN